MSTANKFVRFVSKLLELTQTGALRWERHSPPISLEPDAARRVQVVYTAHHLDRNLRLYGLQRKSWEDDDRYYWEEMVILEFVDDDARTEWRLPPVAGLSELLEAVQYQTSHANEYIDQFLDRVINE